MSDPYLEELEECCRDLVAANQKVTFNALYTLMRTKNIHMGLSQSTFLNIVDHAIIKGSLVLLLNLP